MGKTYLANAFSLSMLNTPSTVKIEEAAVGRVKDLLKTFESAIGHESTAEFLTRLLGIPVPVRRVAIQLAPGDTLVVFQLLQRLPEGKVLSSGELANFPYKFFIVHVL